MGRASYTLRLTLRALHDLGVKDGAPDDFDDIRQKSVDRDIVSKFIKLRTVTPTGTEGPMRNVGRPDIYSLHGRDGIRAATWHDDEFGICWLLGVVREHDYASIEERSNNGELLPTEDDYAIYFEQTPSFEELATVELHAVVSAALLSPLTPQEATLGGLVRTFVAAVAEQLNGSHIADLFIGVLLPPLPRGRARPTDWPGSALLERLAELATGIEFEELDVAVPIQIPNGPTQWRDVNPKREMVIVVKNYSAPTTHSENER